MGLAVAILLSNTRSSSDIRFCAEEKHYLLEQNDELFLWYEMVKLFALL